MLNVANKPIILSDFMLSVVKIIVAAPFYPLLDGLLFKKTKFSAFSNKKFQRKKQ